MGKTLVLHEPSYERIRDLLAKRGHPETENQKKQAMLPPDATVFQNDYGTAPGFAMTAQTDNGEKTMILLPGPPRELEPLYAERVKPYLARMTDTVFYSLNIGLYGIGEAAVGHILRDYMDNGQNPTVAPYCGEGEVRLRLTAKGKNEAECRALCEAVAEQIRWESCEPYKPGCMNDYIWGIDCDSMQEALVKLLCAKQMTVSAAESCTGGYVAKRITDIPGASAVLSGSFVTYSEQTKQSMVGVKTETLAAHSVYSAEIAEEMAQGCRLAVGADIGIGITGVAGTEDAHVTQNGREITVAAGTVFIACTDGVTVRTEQLDLSPGRRSGLEAREYVRRRASSHALYMALRMAEASANSKA
jgi:nicotinamide-nucleotide amidase